MSKDITFGVSTCPVCGTSNLELGRISDSDSARCLSEDCELKRHFQGEWATFAAIVSVKDALLAARKFDRLPIARQYFYQEIGLP